MSWILFEIKKLGAESHWETPSNLRKVNWYYNLISARKPGSKFLILASVHRSSYSVKKYWPVIFNVFSFDR